MKIEHLKLEDFFLEQIAFPEVIAFAEPIDHILARVGVCSLRSARTFLKNNDVRVASAATNSMSSEEKQPVPNSMLAVENTTRITFRNFRVDSAHTPIFINGEQLPLTEHLYLMVDKPLGVVCSRVSDRHQTIFDILPEEIKSHKMYGYLHCVGRLDADTSGLVILTTNGVFSNYMMSPKNHVAKTYEVTLRDEVPKDINALMAGRVGAGEHDARCSVLTQADYVERFNNGIELQPEKKSAGFVAAPAELVWGWCRPEESQCSDGESVHRGETRCTLTIREGKFHQVRRMFAAMGNEVIALRRIAYSNLQVSSSMPFEKIK